MQHHNLKCPYFFTITVHYPDNDYEIITMGGKEEKAERENVMSLCSKWYITNKMKIVMILFGYFTLKYQLSGHVTMNEI